MLRGESTPTPLRSRVWLATSKSPVVRVSWETLTPVMVPTPSTTSLALSTVTEP